MADEPQRFQTGDVVPQTGIYRVAHLAHRLPHEVVIFAGDRFSSLREMRQLGYF